MLGAGKFSENETMYDLIVIGGGVVGLASAWEYTRRYPGRSVLVLEKNDTLAAHQTGRNSGVIHSGIYYKPGSAKALNCRHGKAMLESYCQSRGVAMEICGKVIVAIQEDELERLSNIEKRGRENGVACERIDGDRLREMEPHCAGIAALHVPEAGIVDYVGMCEAMAEDIRKADGEIRLGHKVEGVEADGTSAVVRTSQGTFEGKALINCAGLHSDRMRKLCGRKPGAKIVPFRGEYYELVPDAHHLCKHLIYPVPDPAFPFLGVHFTRMVQGGVECGPNAVLAMAREGYDWKTLDLGDLTETLTYPAFWRLALKYWKTGAGEIKRSLWKRAFVKALSRLVPEIRAEHLVPAEAGVRAQALAPNGKLVDDFLIETDDRSVHVVNAPSPAATACLAIAQRVIGEVDRLNGEVQDRELPGLDSSKAAG